MKLQTFIILLFTSTVSLSQNINEFFTDSNTFFATHVANGKVDYDAIKKDPSTLDKLLLNAKSITVSTSNANTYKAFWINTYNLLTIKGIVNHYPIKSPLDVKGFFDKITYNVGGKNVTLNTIENQLLRAKFKDPRFHFVLVCGAVGCPPLISKAYMPQTLDGLLTTQTKKAINGNFIKINTKKKRIQASQIMEWYKEDFLLKGTEIDFINQYLDTPLSGKYKISYFDYNWLLNKQ